MSKNWLEKVKDMKDKTKELTKEATKKAQEVGQSESFKKTLGKLQEKQHQLGTYIKREIPKMGPKQGAEKPEGPSIFDRWVEFRDNYLVKPFEKTTSNANKTGKFLFNKAKASKAAENIKSSIKETASDIKQGAQQITNSAKEKVSSIPNGIFSGMRNVSRKTKIYAFLGLFGVMMAYGIGTSLPKAYFDYLLESQKLKQGQGNKSP